MSLVDSSHIEGTRMRRDVHYHLRGGKPSMTIWNRDVSEKSCQKCHRGAYEYEKVCPRCGSDLDGMTNEC